MDNFYNFRQENGDWLIVNIDRVVSVNPCGDPKFVILELADQLSYKVEVSYERIYCLLKVHNA